MFLGCAVVSKRLVRFWETPAVVHQRLQSERVRLRQGAPALRFCAARGSVALRIPLLPTSSTWHAFVEGACAAVIKKQTLF